MFGHEAGLTFLTVGGVLFLGVGAMLAVGERWKRRRAGS